VFENTCVNTAFPNTMENNLFGSGKKINVLRSPLFVHFPPYGLKPPASSRSASEDHALFISYAHAILPQISRRVGHKISLQGFAGSDA